MAQRIPWCPPCCDRSVYSGSGGGICCELCTNPDDAATCKKLVMVVHDNKKCPCFNPPREYHLTDVSIDGTLGVIHWNRVPDTPSFCTESLPHVFCRLDGPSQGLWASLDCSQHFEGKLETVFCHPLFLRATLCAVDMSCCVGEPGEQVCVYVEVYEL